MNSHSSGNGQCVEAADAPGAVPVRDSKAASGPVLILGVETWAALCWESVRAVSRPPSDSFPSAKSREAGTRCLRPDGKLEGWPRPPRHTPRRTRPRAELFSRQPGSVRAYLTAPLVGDVPRQGIELSTVVGAARQEAPQFRFPRPPPGPHDAHPGACRADHHAGHLLHPVEHDLPRPQTRRGE
ncbi:DUF397 domain-containing protein [Streptomyces brevispora]|uniref:DUF397 domain-containing protein n=1 Tax=Streptomyces brevispora TaxID=887462 RepID=UPI002E33A1E5|nr:DUF397 domain-containing protein [Streptomyces brevispora]